MIPYPKKPLIQKMEPGLYDYIEKKDPGRLTVTNFNYIKHQILRGNSEMNQQHMNTHTTMSSFKKSINDEESFHQNGIIENSQWKSWKYHQLLPVNDYYKQQLKNYSEKISTVRVLNMNSTFQSQFKNSSGNNVEIKQCASPQQKTIEFFTSGATSNRISNQSAFQLKSFKDRRRSNLPLISGLRFQNIKNSFEVQEPNQNVESKKVFGYRNSLSECLKTKIENRQPNPFKGNFQYNSKIFDQFKIPLEELINVKNEIPLGLNVNSELDISAQDKEKTSQIINEEKSAIQKQNQVELDEFFPLHTPKTKKYCIQKFQNHFKDKRFTISYLQTPNILSNSSSLNQNSSSLNYQLQINCTQMSFAKNDKIQTDPKLIDMILDDLTKNLQSKKDLAIKTIVNKQNDQLDGQVTIERQKFYIDKIALAIQQLMKMKNFEKYPLVQCQPLFKTILTQVFQYFTDEILGDTSINNLNQTLQNPIKLYKLEFFLICQKLLIKIQPIKIIDETQFKFQISKIYNWYHTNWLEMKKIENNEFAEYLSVKNRNQKAAELERAKWRKEQDKSYEKSFQNMLNFEQKLLVLQKKMREIFFERSEALNKNQDRFQWTNLREDDFQQDVNFEDNSKQTMKNYAKKIQNKFDNSADELYGFQEDPKYFESSSQTHSSNKMPVQILNKNKIKIQLNKNNELMLIKNQKISRGLKQLESLAEEMSQTDIKEDFYDKNSILQIDDRQFDEQNNEELFQKIAKQVIQFYQENTTKSYLNQIQNQQLEPQYFNIENISLKEEIKEIIDLEIPKKKKKQKESNWKQIFEQIKNGKDKVNKNNVELISEHTLQKALFIDPAVEQQLKHIILQIKKGEVNWIDQTNYIENKEDNEINKYLFEYNDVNALTFAQQIERIKLYKNKKKINLQQKIKKEDINLVEISNNLLNDANYKIQTASKVNTLLNILKENGQVKVSEENAHNIMFHYANKEGM